MNEKRHLPAVDRVLGQIPELIETHGRQLVTGCVRAELAAAREGLKHGLPLPDETSLLDAIRRRADEAGRANLRAVFNLTGTVLHTNLGRAQLAEEAIAAMVDAARSPCALEYDLASGGRGDRDDLVSGLLAELIAGGSPDIAATIVNNNAAAVLLTLNALAQGKAAAQLVTTPAEKMVATLGVTLLQHTHVTGIDVQTQEVHTASKGSFGYRQLVLATGAKAIRLSFMGNAADEVMSVNSLDDYVAFRDKLKPQARVLIIGAGLIGCEFANDMAAAGFAVQVVDPGAAPLATLLPPQASAQLREALEALQVRWHFGTSASAIDRVDDDYVVTFTSGQTAVVDVVLSAVGLRADTALAQAAGIATERGIVVNAQLQTSAPHVYALGDNTQYASESAGVSRTMPYVMPIMAAATALAVSTTKRMRLATDPP